MVDPAISTSVVSSMIAPPINLIINTWLKPKLDKSIKKRRINKLFYKDITILFSEYLNRTYKQQKSVNILALQLQQVEIDQIYIPLKIYSDEKQERVIINDFDLNFAKKYMKIIIEDSAGMGKSTILKKMFVSSIEKNINIPIFIELRNLTTEKNVIDEIIENFKTINSNDIDKEFIKELMARGDFTFFLDGYDEIPFEHKEGVTKKLLDFIYRTSKNLFFITSRNEESLSCFGQFQRFQIDKLERYEAEALLYKYDSITSVKIANDLIRQIEENIKSKSFNELESFLGNPLLVSLLYLTFKFKRDIPSSKMDFYGKVYDALYESHDLTKNNFKRPKYSNLSRTELQKILMKLGFLCLRENVNSYNKNNLLILISKVIDSSYYMKLNVDHIFKDLTETVPIMICDGLEYKWVHKSFMEYFAALHIDAHKNREEILQRINKSPNFTIYLNMLEFYYDINRKIFDKAILYPILKEYIESINDKRINDKNKDMKKYYQVMYNWALYISEYGAYDLHSDREKLKSQISVHFPLIETYNLILSMSTFTFFHSNYLFVKSYKFQYILEILYIKKNPLVREFERKYDERFEVSNQINKDKLIRKYRKIKEQEFKGIDFDGQFFSFGTPIEEIKLNLSGVTKYMENFVSYSGNKVSNNLLYIDYDTANQYIRLIEADIKKTDADAYLEL